MRASSRLLSLNAAAHKLQTQHPTRIFPRRRTSGATHPGNPENLSAGDHQGNPLPLLPLKLDVDKKILEFFAATGSGRMAGFAHVNTAESYFSLFKRGLIGIYQHVSAQHLKRYVGEFDFRYNYREKLGYNDEARTREALKGIEGKRLTYKPAHA